MNRKLPWMILLATSLFFLASCQSEKKGKVLKLAHGLDAAHPVHKAMVFMGNNNLSEIGRQISHRSLLQRTARHRT
jgi:TRAP-type C4-dicarboxylate transport system substrate-binding protein